MLDIISLYLYAGLLMGESVVLGSRSLGRKPRNWNYLMYVFGWAVVVPLGLVLHYWGGKKKDV